MAKVSPKIMAFLDSPSPSSPSSSSSWIAFLLIASLCTIIIATTAFYVFKRHKKQPRSIAFYHPYCSSGGGGERVLWKIIQVLSRFDHLHVVIYTVDPETETYTQDILQHVQDRFSLIIPLHKMQLSFVHLPDSRYLLQPAGAFSLVRESIGTMRFAYRGLCHFAPSIFIDTTGAAFSFLPAKLFHCQVMTYVHYPTISTDMLQVVWEKRRTTSATSTSSSSSLVYAYAKLLYYCAFALLYGLVGSCTTTQVWVNSTWTYHHIRSLWRGAKIRIIYPPCSIVAASNTTTTRRRHHNTSIQYILSIGQFRPEKDHVLQIQAMERLLQDHPELTSTCRMVLLGSCRNEEDTQRYHALQRMASSDCIEFVVNPPYSTVQEWLSKASVGIHTMWNEHFGIGIVEMMAAGMIVVAHRSGGPLTDIITDETTGYLATTVQEYADSLYKALTVKENGMREKAQQSAERFTDQVFEEAILETLGDVIASRTF